METRSSLSPGCYDENLKHSSKEAMMRGLGITNEQYKTLCDALEEEMRQHRILGTPLNSHHSKMLLDQVVTRVIDRFPGLRKGISLSFLRNCIKARGQRINNNHRRRTSKTLDSNPNPSFAFYPPFTPPTVPLQNSTRPLGTYTVYIERESDGRKTGCCLRDFLSGEAPREDFCIPDLSYQKFLQVLEEEIAFDVGRETPYYNTVNGEVNDMDSERAWKAGLEKMYWKDPDLMLVKIRPRSAGKDPTKLSTGSEGRPINSTAGGDQRSMMPTRSATLNAALTTSASIPASSLRLTGCSTDRIEITTALKGKI
jgi:hypothetical protein